VEIAARTLADLGWPVLVEHWAARCASARGAAVVRKAELFATADAARVRVDEISEARRLASEDARLPLGGVADIADAIARVQKAAALDAPELIAVATTGRAMARLRAHLRERAEVAPRLAAIAAGIADLGHVFHPILEAFDADGKLVDHASDALGPLRKALASIKAQLVRRMDTMLQDERFAPYLQDAYYTQREDRYVLPVRTDGKGFVRGIVHGTSQSGQTLFIEPDEIVDLNNRLKLAECDVADEERRILVRFSNWVGEEAAAFVAALAATEHLDVVAAGALLGDDLVAAAPIIDDAPRIGLLHARHPLMLLADRRCVANDITVDAGKTLLVSGPNAGGKTVVLKTAALAALMVRAGLHIAAESGSVMGWFPDVRTDLGDQQSLEHNLSTFTGHIVNVRDFLATAGPGTLLLVDEIAVGTDPEQGAALAQAVLEALAARGVTAIVTTHYQRLKAVGATDPRFANASVGFDLARMEPTFKLHLGSPGSSGALAVARRTGLGGDVVERAQDLLGAAGTKVEDLLASVADQRRRLEEERAAVLAELEAAEAERAALRQHRDKTKERFDKQLRLAHGDAMAALKAARRDIEGVRAELRRRLDAMTIDDLKTASREVSAAAQTVAQHEPRRRLPPGRPVRDAGHELVPGTAVIVPSLGGRAEVIAAPDKGKVEVRFGAMHSTVDVGEVLLDTHRAAQRPGQESGPSGHWSGGSGYAVAGRRRREQQQQQRAADAGGPLPAAAGTGPIQVIDASSGETKAGGRTIDVTVDVRGQRVDEAVTAVDRFIDESMVTDRDILFVIHGHGTGALRSAIRAHLAQHKAVTRWRAGEKTEGGDGVTVLWLKSA
jgi:DNA mismatch repair protein MutS2